MSTELPNIQTPHKIAVERISKLPVYGAGHKVTEPCVVIVTPSYWQEWYEARGEWTDGSDQGPFHHRMIDPNVIVYLPIMAKMVASEFSPKPTRRFMRGVVGDW